jgi:hypothetical protein
MSPRRALVALACAAFGAAAGLAAQSERPRDPEADRLRAERSLQQSRAEAERLFDLRYRHDLGLLPTTSLDATERAFTPAVPATAEALDRMQAQLREEAAATTVLREAYERQRSIVEQARAAAEAKAVEAVRQPIVAVPAAGRPVPTRASRQRQEAAAAAQAGANAPLALFDAPEAPGAPAGETAPAAPASSPAPAPATSLTKLGAVQAQIVGCNDHQRVAAALLKAGQALVDEAAACRVAGDEATAKQLAERAVERLHRAIEVLAPHVRAKDAPFEVLFCQGRALELLFRHAERYDGLAPGAGGREWEKREQEVRTPWLQIAARDVVKAADAEVLGPWGKAAQTALEHFRWTNLHGSYDAAATIDAIVWPGADAK